MPRASIFRKSMVMLCLNIKSLLDPEDRIDVAQLQPFFPCYSAMEIEDLLCIYHDQIKDAKGTFNPNWLDKLPDVACKSDEASALDCDCCCFS